MSSKLPTAEQIKLDWNNPRWAGIKRNYTAEDVVRLRGSLQIDHTLAKRGAEKLWNRCNTEPFVNALGALTGNQAMQQVKAGLKAIYLSGWQVAGDANSGRRDVSRPVAVPGRLGAQAPCRQAHQQHAPARRPDPARRRQERHRLAAPIVADAEAGFGGRSTRSS
jgi:isocitrate lyase